MIAFILYILGAVLIFNELNLEINKPLYGESFGTKATNIIMSLGWPIVAFTLVSIYVYDLVYTAVYKFVKG